ncbi:MAG: helix-turn-helix domain-containing protein [Thermodesulfobacteria bacterium]|nr:helix-turn-helix domain-containing protein [Thermodesulfobacteriota bacterium]
MAENGTNGGLGEYLKRQREIRNFTLEDIAEQTKISLRALRALEAEDWELLPAEIYIRGFIRCYCETIGLDPNEALLRFEQVYEPFRRQRENPMSEKEYLPGKKGIPLLWIAVALVIIVVVGLGYYFFHVRQKSKTSEVILPPVTEPLETKESPLGETVEKESQKASEEGSSPSSESP